MAAWPVSGFVWILMDYSQIIESVSAAARRVIESGGYRRYSGENCAQLAAELAQRQAASEVVLTSSGTAATELALRALGVTANDEVLLSAYDYPGNFWAIERIGARPVLLDVEPNSWRINTSDLEQLGGGEGNCKALIVSHLHGQLQDVASIRKLCDERKISLVEDACQSLGATLGGRPAGSFGHASIVSFGGGKVLSAGRGGALLTSDESLAQRAKILAGGGSGPYALSELQAAVVNAQLPYLGDIVAHCRQFFTTVVDGIRARENLCIPFEGDLPSAAFYQAGFIVSGDVKTMPPLNTGKLQSQMIDTLRIAGIAAGTGFSGFHRRSARRCGQLRPLVHTANVTDCTVTIHHSVALESHVSAELLAETMDRCVNQ